MRVIKAGLETEDSDNFPLMKNKGMWKNNFRIGVFLGLEGDITSKYLPVFMAIRNNGCKYWANLYHIVLDYLIQSRTQFFDVEIKQHEYGISIVFIVSYPDKYDDSIRNGIIENIERSKLFNESFFLGYKYYYRQQQRMGYTYFYKQQQKILGVTHESN